MEYPERIDLARRPTPLTRLARTSEYLGVDFWIKRDDLTGSALSGNKVRKLEFLLADAVRSAADMVITGGGEQSNHCRATAFAAAKVGLDSHLLLRVDDKSEPAQTTGNILLDRLAGATIEWIDHEDWRNRKEVFAQVADRFRAEGRRPYVIPEGGSNEVGAWGYVAACEELDLQLAATEPVPTTVVYACGSGGTGAGLILGAKHYGFASRGLSVAGFNVCDDRDYFVREIGSICRRTIERYSLDVQISDDDIQIVDGYVGAGYARSRRPELEELRDMARRDAIVFDPVYTGKAFYGLVSELRKDPRRFGERVVFVHTGGIFGLFGGAAADDLAPIL